MVHGEQNALAGDRGDTCPPVCAETEGTHGRFDFGSEKAAAPEDLRFVLDDYESVAYRRRDHERTAMLMKVIGLVPGYAELLELAKEQASTLAAIPPGAAPPAALLVTLSLTVCLLLVVFTWQLSLIHI